MIGDPIGQTSSMEGASRAFGGLVSVADAFHAVTPVTVTAFHEMLATVTSRVSERLQ